MILRCGMATRFPQNILNAHIRANIQYQLSDRGLVAGFATTIINRTRTASPAVLLTTDKNAVTGVGEPS